MNELSPHSNPHSLPAASTLGKSSLTDANARPAMRQAPPASDLWGPYNPNATSPLNLLATVADHSRALRSEVTALVSAITGEAPPSERLREVPRPGGGLLPAITHLSHEIEQAHAEISRLVRHIRGRL